jgi:SWIM zinc finger
MEPRQQKAIEIAAKSKLTRKGDTWLVPSQSGPKKYTVDPNPQGPNCTCPDFEARQLPCKHIFAVEIVVQREYSDDGETRTVTETVMVRKTYKQEWSSYNKAQTNEKAHFLAFLSELCSKVEEPIQKRSRGGQRLPLADVLFTVAFKVYSGMSARRFASDMRDALAKGYVSKAPSFNSVFDYLQMESLTP